MITEHNHTWEYALFSAHMHRYLPALKWEDHPAIYEKWKSIHIPKPIATTFQWELTFLEDWDTGAPKIICLFHLGMHAQIPQLLADAGLCFDILMDREVFEKQKTELLQIQADLNRGRIAYRFLMSDDPRVLLKARTAIKEGKHLLVFADGNSGTIASLEKKVRIDFLDADIYVRTGIALLSFLMQVPVVPLSHVRIDHRYQLFAGEEIGAQRNELRDHYLNRCMQQLYVFLAVAIRTSPWQWECWSYLHEMNCYTIDSSTRMDVTSQERDAGLIHVELEGKKGIFSRKYFCYLPQ